jgi:Tfp pilus assembly protein PilO
VSLTDRDRKIVLALVPLLIIGVYWFMLLAPKRHQATKLNGDASKAQQERDAAVSQAKALESAKGQFAKQYEEIVRLGKAIPTQVDMPSLIVQLDSAARGTGIDFGDIKVGPRVPAAPAAGGSSSGSTASSGSGSPPVAAGGAAAQSAPGQAAEKANTAHNAETNSANQAAQSSGVNPADTQTSTSSKSGGLPVGGGSAGTPSSGGSTANSGVPGLDTVPLNFTFTGEFLNLADFFHRLKRFVHVANDKIAVQGRLVTIDSLKFTSDLQTFPALQADVTATVYLTPKDQGTTAGATSQGPAQSTPGSGSGASTTSTASATPPTATATP